MPNVDNTVIKYKNWQHFFNKKFSGKVQHAPWYFRQLSRAAANNGCAALLKGGAYVIAFRSLDEWRQIYDISLRRSATLRTSLPPPPPPTLSDPQPRHYNAPPMQPMHGYQPYDPYAPARNHKSGQDVVQLISDGALRSHYWWQQQEAVKFKS